MSNNSNVVRVAVIGAGCSGITAIKNLLQVGISNIVCFEQNDQIGGNWIYSPKISHSSVCETTHIISSKTMSEYLDFPMPDHYPDYPSHSELLEYFRSYVQHFNLEPFIKFNTRVEKVEKTEDDKWRVYLDSIPAEQFDFLLVANGHHSVPRMPVLPGTFDGELLHSHAYKTNQAFKDKRVLVIGMGNSGCDCAVEISRVAKHVSISQRNPQYIVPKFMMGKPTDVFNKVTEWLPGPILNIVQKIGLKMQIGSYEDYNLLSPNHSVVSSHPTINSELLYKIRHGKVHPRKSIESVKGYEVRFKDGQIASYDVIIAATGYKIATPFFDKDFLDYEDADRVPLYLRMFHPDHPSLIFIGLFQPQGAIWPGSDAQAKLASNYIVGNWSWPTNINALAEADADEIDRSFIKAKRHTIEVHFKPFMQKLLKQIPSNAPDWPKD
ncbi:MAG: NAD(P)-binding domain-containing protein [Saprospiraceae bacterium]|nr:NAD(P)-binding domain-containing protein [Saprospiraceae bacterium]